MNKCRGHGVIAVGHRIIEIGCVEIVNRRVTGRTYHSYINPKQKIDKRATAIHGITDDQLRDKPEFHEIIDDLLEFIGDSDIIIHNAPFDTAFLDKELKMLPTSKKPWGKTFRYIDTLPMARAIFPGQSNTLQSLCQRFGIANVVEHSAILDALVLAKLFLRLTG